ncbi:hypothetical protein Vafri_21953, partial [Volvox africanus]
HHSACHTPVRNVDGRIYRTSSYVIIVILGPVHAAVLSETSSPRPSHVLIAVPRIVVRPHLASVPAIDPDAGGVKTPYLEGRSGWPQEALLGSCGEDLAAESTRRCWRQRGDTGEHLGKTTPICGFGS